MPFEDGTRLLRQISAVLPVAAIIAIRPFDRIVERLMEVMSTSPDGRYKVLVEPWEASASQWAYTPSIVNSSTGNILYRPSDGRWSVDNSTWDSADRVTLTMRKFPGNHEPAQILVHIDVEEATARVGSTPAVPLAELDDAITKAIRESHPD